MCTHCFTCACFASSEPFNHFLQIQGAGTCGEVRRAINRATGKEYAVKVISLGLMGGFSGNRSKEAKSMEAEARILQSLDDHPYITKFYDVFVAPGVAMYLVMEVNTHFGIFPLFIRVPANMFCLYVLQLLKGGDLFDRYVLECGTES